MAQNFSELAILEGNDNCIPVRLNGIIVDVPRHYFDTKLYNVKDVLDHENQNLLNGIAEHFENEGLMIGDDGFVYASIDPEDKTLSGDGYEPIALLDGEDLELNGFKFKMPKMPRLGKRKSGGLKKVGGLKSKVKLGKAKLGKIKNPFKKLSTKGLSKGLNKAFNSYKKLQSKLLDPLGLSSKQNSEDMMPDEEPPIDEAQTDYSEESAEEEQTDYPEESIDETQTDYSDEVQTESDAVEVGASSDLAFSAVNTALSFVPGGSVASGLLSQGKGIYDQQRNQKTANKQAVSQQRIAMLQNLIKQNPKKKVVVIKKTPTPPQLVKPTQVKQSFSSQTPLVRNTQTTDYQPTKTEPKKDNSMLIGLGALAAVGVAIAMSGSGKE